MAGMSVTSINAKGDNRMTPPREFLFELGRITYHFQSLESAFFLLGSTLITRDQKIGQICLSRISFSQLCTILLNLYRHKVNNQESIETLQSIITRASNLEEKRNTLIHSIYLSDKEDTDGVVTRAKVSVKRRGFTTHFEDMTEEDIRLVANDISSLFNEFLQFLKEIHDSGLVILPVVDV